MFQKSLSFLISLFIITACSDDSSSKGPTPFIVPDNVTFHSALLKDINGDNVLDIITSMEYFNLVSGETEKGDYLIWFKGDPSSPTKFENNFTVIGPHMTGLFIMNDIDNDNDEDVLGASFYSSPTKTFGWYERSGTAANPQWEYHVINSELGEGFQLNIVNGLFADTSDDYLIGTNHVNSLLDPDGPEASVFLFAVPDDPASQWEEPIVISSDITADRAENGVLAPGASDYGDLDGDGDIDIIVSGDGDSNIYMYEQTSTGEFMQHVLEENQPQTGLMKIIDLNNDGNMDVVMPCYENNKLFLYKGSDSSDTGASNKGSYYYNRITLDDTTIDSSTFGPAFVTIDDMNGDTKPDIIVSNYGLMSSVAPSIAESFRSGVVLFVQGDNLDTWTKVVVQEQDGTITFATKTDTGDIDGDGDKDVLLPAGFFPCLFLGKAPCGGIHWYENPGDSDDKTWTMHSVWVADH